jgi:uncharacterized protein (TIGR02217 family)
MAFLESPRLSVKISFGAQGGPVFAVEKVTVRSGYEKRNLNESQARHQYEIGLTVRPESEFDLIRDHFMAVNGPLDGFRYKDWADFEVTTVTGRLVSINNGIESGTAGLGYGNPTAQLKKRYTRGNNTYLRDITKPVASTFVVRKNGVTLTLTTDYTLDATTGIITFVATQTRSISSHTPGVAHTFTLASAFSPNLAIGGRIYVSGITGTAATILNGLSHEVTNVAAAVITVSTVTTGLTASGGTASFFPQPTDTVDFSCEFDVPVRFDVDQFDAVIVDRNGAEGELLLELPSVPLIELKL